MFSVLMFSINNLFSGLVGTLGHLLSLLDKFLNQNDMACKRGMATSWKALTLF